MSLTTTPTINKPTQLLLHATLGATTSAIKGDNILSGALSGITGELSAEYLDNHYGNSYAITNNTNPILNKTQIIESSKLIGALTSAVIVGPDDANSVFSGADIARNAAQNNALDPWGIEANANDKEKFSEGKEKLDNFANQINEDIETKNQITQNIKETKSVIQTNLASTVANSDNNLTKATAFTALTAVNITFPESFEEVGLIFLGSAASGLKAIERGLFTTSLSSGVVKPDFYANDSGTIIPATGYRAIGGPSVERAINGDLMSKDPFTYFTFDDVSKMTPAQAKDLLQLPYTPSHYGSFDTLHQFDNISIPTTNWNKGNIPEPITTSFPEFGTGGATQVITKKPIENFQLNKINND